MRKKIFLHFLLLAFTLAACDAQRNEMLRSIFIAPTATQPAPSATATPFPTPTKIPTLKPETRVETADHFFLAGDYDNAEAEYGKALANNDPNSEIGLAASLGLARIAAIQGDGRKCINILEPILSASTFDERYGPFWFLISDCFDRENEYESEIASLRNYLSIVKKTYLAGEITERIGDIQYNSGHFQDARVSYKEAISLNNPALANSLKMKIANSLLQEKNFSEAIQVWLDILETADGDLIKAQINYQLAQAYIELGEIDQAFSRFQENVNNYPRYYAAYQSLLALRENGQPVNEFQRGLINYYVNQYALALDAFNRYIKSEATHDGSAYYYIGLCQMYLENYDEALSSFREIARNYPDNKFYASAWDEIAYIQWNFQKKYLQAANSLNDFVKKRPDQPESPNFLYEAGRILERGGYLSEAADQWQRLLDEYPLYERSGEAFFFAAICRYRKGEYEMALANLNRLLLVSAVPNELAKIRLWIAKVYLAKGDQENYQKYLKLAAEDAPTEYYSERASEILRNSEPLEFTKDYALSVNLAQEFRVAEQWLRINFKIPDAVILDQPEDLLLDNNYLKANELWNLGRYQEALASFDSCRMSYEADAINSFRLLKRLIDIGAWRVAVFTSRQILSAAGLIENVRTISAPNYFNHIRYGTWFQELVQETSETYGVHPFLLYAMMRQESMYDPWIESPAGAQGLMQIMPATGQEIAKSLHWPYNYAQSDLLRAFVAIRFSGSYISRQHTYFGKNFFVTLASYNAGPGNTSAWVDIAENDADLFLEIVRIEETRNYIRNVYEFAKMYERLYSN